MCSRFERGWREDRHVQLPDIPAFPGLWRRCGERGSAGIPVVFSRASRRKKSGKKGVVNLYLVFTGDDNR